MSDDDIDELGERAYGSTTGEVLDFIVKGLTTGKYRPGQRLNAATLCRELNLSKAPVREALHMLAGEGVIDMPKNRGAFIRELTPTNLLQLWEVSSLAFGREIRVAAHFIYKPEASAAIAAAMGRIRAEQKRGPGLAFFQSLNFFHAAVSEVADNPFLVSSQLRRLVEFWLPYVLRAVPLEVYIGTYVANYERITSALLAGDGRTAESAFHYHARWSAAIIKGDRPPPDGPWCDEEGPVSL
jgi:DNA-binding GntR family transcriptional regulator